MATAERLSIVSELERRRGSRIICYLTSTRPNTNFQMGSDVVPRLYEHLRALAAVTPKPKVELFLHSNGGDGVAPWRIVTLIREFASEFNVLIPHRAFSAATLVSLGADKIWMHPMVVGPTDPTVANPFNPVDPSNPQGRLGISVEDVYAYIALIKEDVGIKGESDLVQAFKTLTEQLHPLALGNVKRFYSQSRMMAKKLLALHMNEKTEHSLIHDIADNLTSKLFFHGHPINRLEAKAIGLKVEHFQSPTEEDLIWNLYSDFASEMKMDEEFNFVHDWIRTPAGTAVVAGTAAATAVADIDPVVGAYVESSLGTHSYTQTLRAVGARDAIGNIQGSVMVLDQGWSFAAAAPSPASTTAAGPVVHAAPPAGSGTSVP